MRNEDLFQRDTHLSHIVFLLTTRYQFATCSKTQSFPPTKILHSYSKTMPSASIFPNTKKKKSVDLITLLMPQSSFHYYIPFIPIHSYTGNPDPGPPRSFPIQRHDPDPLINISFHLFINLSSRGIIRLIGRNRFPLPPPHTAIRRRRTRLFRERRRALWLR
jgi:hypothetical protein